MRAVALTTVDNPWSPFDNFLEWYIFDVTRGYNSCGKLARLTKAKPNEMTDHEIAVEAEIAIDKLIKADPLGLYMKVFDKDDDELEN